MFRKDSAIKRTIPIFEYLSFSGDMAQSLGDDLKSNKKVIEDDEPKKNLSDYLVDRVVGSN